MNKVISINLGGTAYQLEEAAYDALRAYLDSAAARLQGNPDREEILSDIERAIGEKFRALLNNYKTVVVTKEVADVLAQMGPIEDDSNTPPETAANRAGSRGAPESGATGPGQAGAAPKRLYRIYDGAMISGVCTGLAAYLRIDPTLVRLAFVLLTFFWASGSRSISRWCSLYRKRNRRNKRRLRMGRRLPRRNSSVARRRGTTMR
jgi:phage shock protein PspC (stress-responsive transcriptional regulator)